MAPLLHGHRIKVRTTARPAHAGASIGLVDGPMVGAENELAAAFQHITIKIHRNAGMLALVDPAMQAALPTDDESFLAIGQLKEDRFAVVHQIGAIANGVGGVQKNRGVAHAVVEVRYLVVPKVPRPGMYCAGACRHQNR